MTQTVPRPDFWTQDWVLDRLSAGFTVTDLLTEAAEGQKISPATLRSDIARWKRHNEKFNRDFSRILYRESGRHSIDTSPPRLFTPYAQERFWVAMETHEGRVADACLAADVKPSWVYTRVNPNSPEYDPDFAQRFHEAETPRLAKIREHLLDSAEESEWAAQKVLEADPTMGHLHNPKRRLEVSGGITHTHEISASAMAAVVEKRRLFGYAAGRENGEGEAASPAQVPALPAHASGGGEVIDVTPGKARAAPADRPADPAPVEPAPAPAREEPSRTPAGVLLAPPRPRSTPSGGPLAPHITKK